ncbi:MAG TPA: alpha/beta hydrolase [Acidimicrobiales bacterium]|nr:alpha/beta hydrolase [Acidimicrobiales bacterium]
MPNITYPGARRPDRTRSVDACGVRIAVYEWGAPESPPLLLVHGGFDFAGTFDVFAPMLADGGWRVVSWDHRGHGDSEHAALYSWSADMRDAMAVLASTTDGPVAIVGHSKGGNLMLSVCGAIPERVVGFVNIDGMPSPGPHPDMAEHEADILAMQADRMTSWLDHRRRTHELVRKPGTLEDLARRRGRMNPLLSQEWLQYLVTIGARKDADGWRWKIDPTLRFGGFGPWRHQWSVRQLAELTVPFLGMIGTIHEDMGWGAVADDLRPHLPTGGRLEVFEDTGHFIHIEHPRRVADLVLEFLT